MRYIDVLIILAVAFIICLEIDKIICGVKFNEYLVKRARRDVEKHVTLEQKNNIIQFIVNNTVVNGDITSAPDIIMQLPIELRFNLNERRLKGILCELNYKPLNNCFLDTDYYNFSFKK